MQYMFRCRLPGDGSLKLASNLTWWPMPISVDRFSQSGRQWFLHNCFKKISRISEYKLRERERERGYSITVSKNFLALANTNWERERERPFRFVETSASSATTSCVAGALVGTSGRSNFSSCSSGDCIVVGTLGTLGRSWTVIWTNEGKFLFKIRHSYNLRGQCQCDHTKSKSQRWRP